MNFRAICQVMNGIKYALAIWNPQEQRWNIDRDLHDKPLPNVPMMGDGWVFQYLEDDEWKSHAYVFDHDEKPSPELFDACA